MEKTHTARIIVCTILVLVMSLPASAHASHEKDFLAQFEQLKFFNQPQSARTTSMAGSITPTLADNSSTFANPAGLGWVERPSVSASYDYRELNGDDPVTDSRLYEHLHSGYTLAALPLGMRENAPPCFGTTGFGWSGLKNTGNDTFDSEFRNWRLHAAYGKEVAEDLAAGMTASYYHNTLKSRPSDEKMKDGVRIGGGVAYRFDPRTTLGFDSAIGFGTGKVTGNESGDERDNPLHSWSVEGGVSRLFVSTLMALSVDYTDYAQKLYSDGQAWGVRLGIEQPLLEWLTLRAGDRFAFVDGFDDVDQASVEYLAASAGAGIRLSPRLLLDYAAEYQAVGGGEWAHTVNLTFGDRIGIGHSE